MTESVEGRTLGAYRIGAKLGAGGIGAVYEATHVRTGRTYAIKVLLPESALEQNAMRRFQREAEALATLGHVGIVAVHDFDVTEDGIAFLVMDRLHGEDLAARLERGPLPLDSTLRIFDEVAEALAAAHDAGILHRDLKPSNVFLARRPGAPERAILLDFGLAKMMDATESQRLTATGATMGTPLYMSPEQAQGIDLDERTDVYSLAAILFQMVTGSPPFTGPTVTAILAKVLTHPPPLLRSIEPSAPEELEPVIHSALAKSPAERPATVRAFKTQVLRVVTSVAATTPLTDGASGVPPTMFTPRRVIPPSPVAEAPPAKGAAGAMVTPPSQGSNPAALSRPDYAPRHALWTGLAIGLTVGLGVVAWLALGASSAEDAPTPIVPAEVAPAPTVINEALPDASHDAEAENLEVAPPSPPEARPSTSARMAPARRARVPRVPEPLPQTRNVVASRNVPRGGSASAATVRMIEGSLAQARRSASEGIRRARAKMERLTSVLPAIAQLRRNLGSVRSRPPICEQRADLEVLGRVPSLHGSLRVLKGQIEQTCEIFDGWANPSAQVRERIDRLGERFARARRDLEQRSDEVLPPTERDALLADLDALERVIAAADRFPCAAPQVRSLMRHATAVGPRGAQPALTVGRAIDAICNSLRYGQLAPAHRQLTRTLDSVEATVHQLIASQRAVIEGLERARASYGAPSSP